MARIGGRGALIRQEIGRKMAQKLLKVECLSV